MKDRPDIMKTAAVESQYTPVPRKSLADFKRSDWRDKITETKDGIRITQIYPGTHLDVKNPRIDTPEKFLGLIRWLCGKKHMTKETIKGLISFGLARFGNGDANYSDSPSVDWIVKDVIAKGDVGTISGPPFVGKTFLGLQLAHAVATGRGFLGMPVPRARRVVYINAKLTKRGLWERFDAIERATGAKPEADLYYYSLYNLHYKRREKMMAEIIVKRIKQKGKVDLVVIDDAAHFSDDVFACLIDRLSKISAVALMAEREISRYSDFTLRLRRNDADNGARTLHVDGKRCLRPSAIELAFRDDVLKLV